MTASHPLGWNTDFDDWSKSERAWVTWWMFYPSGKWVIVDQTQRSVEDQIKNLHKFRVFGYSLTEYHAIQAFKEYRESGKPVTMPGLHKHGNLFYRLKVAVGALLGYKIYSFITISRDIDRTAGFYMMEPLEPIGNWR